MYKEKESTYSMFVIVHFFIFKTAIVYDCFWDVSCIWKMGDKLNQKHLLCRPGFCISIRLDELPQVRFLLQRVRLLSSDLNYIVMPSLKQPASFCISGTAVAVH